MWVVDHSSADHRCDQECKRSDCQHRSNDDFARRATHAICVGIELVKFPFHGATDQAIAHRRTIALSAARQKRTQIVIGENGSKGRA